MVLLMRALGGSSSHSGVRTTKEKTALAQATAVLRDSLL